MKHFFISAIPPILAGILSGLAVFAFFRGRAKVGPADERRAVTVNDGLYRLFPASFWKFQREGFSAENDKGSSQRLGRFFALQCLGFSFCYATVALIDRKEYATYLGIFGIFTGFVASFFNLAEWANMKVKTQAASSSTAVTTADKSVVSSKATGAAAEPAASVAP